VDTPLRIAVCEDTLDDAEFLLKCISESAIPSDCRVFSSCKTLLADFIPGYYDIIFLDIYMDNMQQGIDVAAKIREMDPVATLAFTTFSKGHALDAYRLKVFAYLEKPVRFEDVRDVLEHARNERNDAPTIQLLIERRHQEIKLDSILYFEQKNQIVILNTLSGILRTSQSVKLRDIEPLLPDYFFRCHHSYIANLNYVAELDQDLRMFRMQNGDSVYIRRQSLGKAIKAFEHRLFEMVREDKHEKIQ
jgi:DNA-binding LytR/AlgR family response regulator